MRELVFTVEAKHDGISAQDFLREKGFSRRAITGMKHSQGLTRGGEPLRSIDPVFAGEQLRVVLEDKGGLVPNGDIIADVLYEDDDIIVFDKPPALPVHPSILHYTDTLGNLFAAKFPDLPFRPINRLDKDTSGCCAVAKNRFSAAAVSGSIQKVYFAVVDGEICGKGTLDFPIDREAGSIIRRCVCDSGKPALTHYEAVAHGNNRTLLRIVLETGRTHQIRVHFAHIGFPLCGDDLYGGDCTAIGRQALHCGEVSFVSPVSGGKITVTAELPRDMVRLLDGE